jgi:hypothetical protein
MFEFDMMALHLGIPNLMKFLLQRLVERLPKSTKINTEVGTGYQGGYHALQGNPIGNPPLGGPYIYICYNVQDFTKYPNFVSMNIMLISILKISTNLDLQI